MTIVLSGCQVSTGNDIRGSRGKKNSRSNLPFWSLSEVIVPNFENSRPNFQYFERSENVKTFKSFSLKI